jgi:hypothetical protein
MSLTRQPAPTQRALTVGSVGLVSLVAFHYLAVATAMPTVAQALAGERWYALAFAGSLAAGVVGKVAGGGWSDGRGCSPGSPRRGWCPRSSARPSPARSSSTRAGAGCSWRWPRSPYPPRCWCARRCGPRPRWRRSPRRRGRTRRAGCCGRRPRRSAWSRSTTAGSCAAWRRWRWSGRRWREWRRARRGCCRPGPCAPAPACPP